MIEEEFHGYRLKAWPMETRTKKYTVCVIIERETEGLNHREQFTAHDGIEYILEIEAAKESLNLGRNLIKAKLTGF